MSPYMVKRCGVIRHLPVERSTEVRAVLPPTQAHHLQVVIRRNGEIIKRVYAH
ncbi:MAG: hypothetical protein NTX72_04770 [Candidatus Uhrbacteria bacterium]|nr:hypothetical protein [Candidatus Uhrbacteria bacterium]